MSRATAAGSPLGATGGAWTGSAKLCVEVESAGKMAGSPPKALRLLRLPPLLSFSLSQEPLPEDDVSGKRLHHARQL